MADKPNSGDMQAGRLALLVASGLIAAFGLLAYVADLLTLSHTLRFVFPVAGIVYAVYFIITFRFNTRSKQPTSSRADVLATDVWGLLEKLDSVIPAEASAFYLQMIVDPARYTTRCTDRIVPSTRSHEHTRSLTIGIPDRLAQNVTATPIGLMSKTSLVNRLKVTEASGRSLTTLSQDTTIAHSAQAIRGYVRSVGGRSDLYARYSASVERAVLTHLCVGSPIDAHDQNLKRLIEQILDLGKTKQQTRKLLILARFVRSLATHYPLVVQVSPGDLFEMPELHSSQSVKITTVRRTIPVYGAGITLLDKARTMFRDLFGIRPVIIDLDLSDAQRCRSYHLECNGPDGSYLARQTVYVTPAAATDALQYCNFKKLPRNGQRFSHLYIHRQGKLRSEHATRPQLRYSASFFERPPGSTAASTVSAFTAAALISIAAASRLSIAGDDGSSDVVSILLALPIVASAYLGFSNGPAIFLGALGARVTLLATMLLSLAASTMYMLGPLLSAENLDDHWWVRPGADRWVFLVGSAWLVTLGCALSLLLRTVTYAKFIRKAKNDDA